MRACGRIVQNIGGIANLTAIPAGAAASDVVAFDTGPGNMVIDAVTEKLFGQPFDRDGQIAGSGIVLEPVIRATIARRVFPQKASKDRGPRGIWPGVCAEVLAKMLGAPESKTSSPPLRR